MLHICPRLTSQSFVEPPFEEEILAFLHFLGHSGEIRKLTDVNINKLHQPQRSFAAIINKCLTEKSSGCDSLRLSQAQILDDHIFSTIKLVSRYQNTQQFGVVLPIELTNEDSRNSNAYKEYYAVATGATPPKPKASTTFEKGKQAAKAFKAKSLCALSEATATVHHHSIRFKMNNKKRIVNLEYFKEMLHICLRLCNQTFDELPFEEEILEFLRYLGHSGEIKKITDVNINKNDLDSMSLDDLYNHLKVYEAEVQKKPNINSQDMAFISSSKNNNNKDGNTVCVTTASTAFPTGSVNVATISQDTASAFIASQSNGSQIKFKDINQIDEDDMKEMDIKWNMALLSFDKSKVKCFNCHKMGHFARECREPRSQERGRKESYRQGSKAEEKSLKALMAIDEMGWDWSYMANKEDHALPKASVRKTRSSFDTTITPLTADAGLRLTTFEKGKQAAKASKAKSLSALSKVAMTKAQQMKLATKRSLQQTHISQASGSGDDDEGNDGDDDDGDDNEEGDGDDDEGNDGDDDDGDDNEEGDGDDDEDDDGEEGNDDDQEDEGDDDDDDEEKGGDDEQASDEKEFIHPSLSTHTKEETRDEESFDPIPKTPEDTDDEGNSEENLCLNVGREEGHDEEEKEDELYKDININQGRGIQTTQEFEDSHVTLTSVNPDGQQQSSSVSSQFVTSMLNPTPDAGMESIFETTSQIDVQTPTSVAPLPMSAPTITPSTIATITTTQQAPTLLTIAPSNLLQDLPNFGSLFGFNNRLRTLEANLSEFMKSNQFAGAVSAIPRIIQRYMDQRMNEAVKVAVQIQSDHLRDEAQKENDDFLKTIDGNMQKIIKEQVKEQVKTSYVVAADLSEMELKKILIEKMEGDKSIHRSNEQRNLYKALVEAYESDKIILDTYGDTVTLKRRRDNDVDKDEEPSVGSYQGPRDAKKERSLSQQALQRRKLPGALESHYNGLNLDRRQQASLLQQRSQCRPPFRWKSPHIQSFKQVLMINQFDGTLTDVYNALNDRLKGIRMKYLPQSIWRKSDKDRAAAMIQAIDKRLKTRRIMWRLERFVGGRLYEGDFRML
nr:hypothetical protein [Tanacetum cinerariifolium]